ncbi:alanine racemase|uniref:Alanine racemase n=1 Tax=Dendrosporobacter quercicolus TaxID=146817 RepID=A0A1G9Z5P3_9FIRM|nr:alanine racemase [Dendrosporobacter quercicolus]NSL48981.1 alanine racemase [Dendrosporobacter quercicolus DSM 1736]SDN16527.1 alanine racemase [Dendrosporobacter quercicolus]
MFERPAWAEIDLAAIAHNVREIKGLLRKGTKFCAVVKADAYGHGVVPVARAALAAGADCLAVAIVSEALELRAAGFREPILVLGYMPPQQAVHVVESNIEQTVFSIETARALSQAATGLGKAAKVHIKIDTGMTRLGVRWQDAAAFAEAVAALPGIIIQGIFSHFAAADAKDKTYTIKQFGCFEQALTAVRQRGINIPIRHIANSAAILDLPETQLDMVRAGIILYGLWPSKEVERQIDLQPVMRFKALVSFVKQVPAGVAVSYGCAYITERSGRIATVPVGYADGWTRLLSPKASVIIRGQRAKIVGRICMDQFMVDVTDIPGVEEGDEVLLFGGSELSADEVAAHLGTINYEVVCMIGKRVPRDYR